VRGLLRGLPSVDGCLEFIDFVLVRLDEILELPCDKVLRMRQVSQGTPTKGHVKFWRDSERSNRECLVYGGL